MMHQHLNRYFQLDALNTTVWKEFLGALTTFTTMAYIIFINPRILSEAGMDFGAVMTATILTAACGCFIMGFFARYPFALAPGLGLNAYFTYSVVLSGGYSWEQALGLCFFASLILIILNILGVREAIMNAIPPALRLGTIGGIGIFLSFIGLKEAKIIIPHSDTFLMLGDLNSPEVFLTCFGVVLMTLLMVYRIQWAIFASILFLWLLGIALGYADWKGIIDSPPSLMPTIGKMDLYQRIDMDMITVVFSFVFVSIFDAAGSLISLAEHAKLVEASTHKIPRARRALSADAIGSLFGSTLGTSPLSTFLESAAGISTGAKSGLCAVFIGFFFLLALFISPLALSIPSYATAPALILVGMLMARQIRQLNWDDLTEFIPAFITMITIPFSFTIAAGIGFGCLTFVLLKAFSGKYRETHWIVYLIAIGYSLRFYFG